MRALTRGMLLIGLSVFVIQAHGQVRLPFGKDKEVAKLSSADITKLLVLKKGDIDKCRDEHKKKEPSVSGKLVARFAVDTSGKTTDVVVVSTEFKGTTFEKCLNETIKGWTFTKAKEKSAPYEMPQTF
jgi:hypothetical protein